MTRPPLLLADQLDPSASLEQVAEAALHELGNVLVPLQRITKGDEKAQQCVERLWSVQQALRRALDEQ